jgi:hypothetical protein
MLGQKDCAESDTPIPVLTDSPTTTAIATKATWLETAEVPYTKSD